jgi:hypothetical protein
MNGKKNAWVPVLAPLLSIVIAEKEWSIAQKVF